MKTFLTILVLAVISAAGVAVSYQIPIEWQNPPQCCDIPTGGTYYGFPFEMKGVACCGIAGTPIEYVKAEAKYYNFLTYFGILLVLFLIVKAFVYLRKWGHDEKRISSN